MAGFGNGTHGHPGSHGRPWSGRGSTRRGWLKTAGRPDSATLGIIGTVCAVAGFFALGIVLGPVAVVCGWLAMGRSWAGAQRSVPALVALVLGAIDTLLAIVWLAGAATWGNGIL
ncbi:small hydrophobic protein [Streptomyces sp. NPDC004065]|uniref:small hydrophobic protein n=1 Tax=Streptomyces sp. NPDC004065 TaxID=3364689 RepID=UPI00384EC639